jgi:hypothetical protein
MGEDSKKEQDPDEKAAALIRRLVGGDMDDQFTESERGTLNHTVGAIALTWAQMEGGLTLVAQTAFTIAGPNSSAKEVPFPFAQKTRYIKQALRDTAQFSQYRDSGRELIIRADAMAKPREAITHGHLAGFRRDGFLVRFDRHAIENGKRVHYMRIMSLDRLGEILVDLRKLARDMSAFALRFSDVLPSEDKLEESP